MPYSNVDTFVCNILTFHNIILAKLTFFFGPVLHAIESRAFTIELNGRCNGGVCP